MKLQAIKLDGKSMAGIGTYITPSEGQRPATGAEFSFGIVADDLGLSAPLCAGRLECAGRNMRVVKLERHLKTPEILSAVDGDSVICVAPPQEPVNGSLAGMKAILVKKGESIVLATGAWHWIPFPVGKESSLFLVVFRSGTGDDDLGFCELSEAVDLVYEGVKK